jgi:hypothetical protein
MRRVILPLMLLTVACRTAPVELTPEQKTEVTDDFRQFRLGLYASDEALDPEPMLSSVAQDAALVIQGMELSYGSSPRRCGPASPVSGARLST